MQDRRGSKMQAHDVGDAIPLKPKSSFFEMMGADAKVATVKEMKTLLDKLREEDAYARSIDSSSA